MFFGRHHGFQGGGGGGGLVVFLIGAALIVALMAVGVYLLVRTMSHPGRRGWVGPGHGGPPWAGRPDGAVEAVRMRYAQGQLSRDDYFRLMNDLVGPGGPSGAPMPPPYGPGPGGHPSGPPQPMPPFQSPPEPPPPSYGPGPGGPLPGPQPPPEPA